MRNIRQESSGRRKRIAVVFGTRPEAIKLAPLVLALRQDRDIDCSVCVTAQHRELLDQVLEEFGIIPDVDLDLMRPNQTLADLTSRALLGLDLYFRSAPPDLVLVQGDTTTVFSASLAAFYNRIPVGHVEAGLRSGNLLSPWPEEANRILTSHLAALHFAPTETNRLNLIKEGIAADRIFVTGNTVVDALQIIRNQVRAAPPEIPGYPEGVRPKGERQPLVLITGHRRENFGPGFEAICKAIAELARLYPETLFIYPVHLNPHVRGPVKRILGSSEHPNIHLIEPVPYRAFVALMDQAQLILTDSGGIQEEAPTMGKPVLVMRDTTERPEAIAAGVAKLVGTQTQAIVGEARRLIADAPSREAMARIANPFGDGKATERILAACRVFLGLPS